MPGRALFVGRASFLVSLSVSEVGTCLPSSHGTFSPLFVQGRACLFHALELLPQASSSESDFVNCSVELKPNKRRSNGPQKRIRNVSGQRQRNLHKMRIHAAPDPADIVHEMNVKVGAIIEG
jgi:hypothetical protein